MGNWVLDWSRCDAEQCWWEISQLWESDGFRVSLTSQRSSIDSAKVNEDKWELVGDSARPRPGSPVQQNSWTETSP